MYYYIVWYGMMKPYAKANMAARNYEFLRYVFKTWLLEGYLVCHLFHDSRPIYHLKCPWFQVIMLFSTMNHEYNDLWGNCEELLFFHNYAITCVIYKYINHVCISLWIIQLTHLYLYTHIFIQPSQSIHNWSIPIEQCTQLERHATCHPISIHSYRVARRMPPYQYTQL